jgi:hypothetical protein
MRPIRGRRRRLGVWKEIHWLTIGEHKYILRADRILTLEEVVAWIQESIKIE